MIFERMHAEYQRLDEKIKTLTAQLEQLPKGNFYCVRNGKYAKWYFNDGKQKIYIPQKNRSDAEVLAIQKYLSLQLEDCVREQKLSNFISDIIFLILEKLRNFFKILNIFNYYLPILNPPPKNILIGWLPHTKKIPNTQSN